mmetsp:Transcript_94789/g.220030  ORF Transcript_94789/g.220030 Transcript_94789/m.220030 type:complete len:239 (-) Transcript_94789:15-731(-)
MLEAAVVAVGDGAVGEKRGEDQVHLCLHVLVAHDVQVRLLLACERGIGEVLCGRRGAHGKGEGRAAAADALPLLLQLLLEVGLERRLHDLVADGLANLHELVHVLVNRLVTELIVDELVDAALVEELLVGKGRGAEATGHWHAHVRELGDHFAQRGALAADLVHIGVAQLLERYAHAGVLLAAPRAAGHRCGHCGGASSTASAHPHAREPGHQCGTSRGQGPQHWRLRGTIQGCGSQA